jgi:hypothetical protein
VKKFVSIIVLAVVMFSFSTVAFSNSGPVFWQGYPSSDIISIKDNSPIMVNREDLVFDFSDYDGSGYAISGRVTATYEMFNPTDRPQSVQMAFPFVGRLNSLSPDDIHITADGNMLPYDLYIGDVVSSRRNSMQEDKGLSFDFVGIIGAINDNIYKAKNFEENEKGKLYTIYVKPATHQRINFAVDFNFDYERTKVLTNGFNRYERNDKKTKIAAWCYEPEILEVFVLGEDIDFNINAYTDGELREKTDLFTYQISVQEMELRSYLMEYIKSDSNMRNSGMISDIQLYNLYAKSLDKCFSQAMGYSSRYDLADQENYERLLTLMYNVEFPQDSKKEVSVSYRASGTMDRTKTIKPIYSFDYIFNPAKNWADFKNLNIKIITPREAPYIVKSSIEFTNAESNVYTAALEDLPEDDLSFSLYENKKVTLLDRAVGNLRRNFGYFTFFVAGAGMLLIIGAIIMAVTLKRKNNKYLN